MKLEQKLLINREWSQNNDYWSTGNEVRAATIDQRLEVRTTTIDQQGMKLEQHLLINRAWS